MLVEGIDAGGGKLAGGYFLGEEDVEFVEGATLLNMLVHCYVFADDGGSSIPLSLGV